MDPVYSTCKCRSARMTFLFYDNVLYCVLIYINVLCVVFYVHVNTTSSVDSRKVTVRLSGVPPRGGRKLTLNLFYWPLYYVYTAYCHCAYVIRSFIYIYKYLCIYTHNNDGPSNESDPLQYKHIINVVVRRSKVLRHLVFILS